MRVFLRHSATVDPATVEAMQGALMVTISHGISTGALFLLIGMIYERRHTRLLADYGGLASVMPLFAVALTIVALSSIGVPGTNGFVGEFLIFRGVFGLHPVAAAIATLGLLATALFLLTFWQRVFHGPRAGVTATAFADLNPIELATLLPLAVLMAVFGLFPGLLTGLFNPLITSWADHLTLP